MGPSAQELAVVRVSPDRQGEPALASGTVECASSRRLPGLASANITCQDAASAYDASSSDDGMHSDHLCSGEEVVDSKKPVRSRPKAHAVPHAATRRALGSVANSSKAMNDVASRPLSDAESCILSSGRGAGGHGVARRSPPRLWCSSTAANTLSESNCELKVS